MSDCSDLIGLRYQLGADGTNGQIDCIHLVYTVQSRIGVKMPPFNANWYEATRQSIARDLLTWGHRVSQAEYDGDILLFRQELAAFAVAWQTGILYINPQTERVNWSPLSSITSYHCFRSNGS